MLDYEEKSVIKELIEGMLIKHDAKPRTSALSRVKICLGIF